MSDLLITCHSYSCRQRKAVTRQTAKSRENIYILATGSAVCSYAGAFAAGADCGIANRRPSPQALAAGDIFGAAHFLLDRAPELPCLCPLLLRWHPLAQAVEAVGTCTLVQLCMYITCIHAYTSARAR